MKGRIVIDGQNILEPDTDLIALRRKVGMVFQRPNVFSLSIYNNLKFGLRIHNMLSRKDQIMQTIRQGLEQVGLWDDLKDKLSANAQSLTLEQQQRLCIARVLILRPDIILLDEPCSALDPDRDPAGRGTAPRAAQGLYAGHRHPQHAAGGPRLGFHGIHVPRPPDRIRRHPEDFHEPRRATDRRLHKRILWIDFRFTIYYWRFTMLEDYRK